MKTQSKHTIEGTAEDKVRFSADMERIALKQELADLRRQNGELVAALKLAYVPLEKSVHFQSDFPYWRKGGQGYSAMLEVRAAIANATGENNVEKTP